MFSWFSPKCPLVLRDKAWVEYRFRSLVDALGPERLRRTVVLDPARMPIPEIHGPTPDVNRLLDRLVEWLDLPAGLTVRVVPDKSLPDAAGVYIREFREIQIGAAQLTEPGRLLGVMIHEALHDLLLHGGFLSGQETDHEQMTDLASVVLGLGIPLANQTIRDRTTRVGHISEWNIDRVGYLSSQELGYAFALFCHARGEPLPVWIDSLRPDAAETLRRGLKYLTRSPDTLVPVHPEPGCSRPTLATALTDFQSGTPTRRLAALWDIASGLVTGPEVRRAGLVQLEDDDETVRSVALESMLDDLQPSEIPAVVALVADHSSQIPADVLTALLETTDYDSEIRTALLDRLADLNGLSRGPHLQTRRQLVRCLSRFCPDDAGSLQLIEDALSDRDAETADAAIEHCANAKTVSPSLLEAVRRRVRRECDERNDVVLRPLLRVLLQLSPSAEIELNVLFPDPADGPDRQFVRQCMKSAQGGRR